MNPTPRLREDVAIVEQVYRGELSYVVKDLESQKYFRFRPVEVAVIRCFDGNRTCGAIAAALREEGIGVSEGAVEGFAQKLNRMGLMERSLAERSTLQMERLRAERQRRKRPTLFRGEVMRMRWSMGDPDDAFDRWLPWLRPLFTRRFVLFSLALFVANIAMMVFYWPKFQAGFAQLTDFGSYTLGQAVLFWFTLLTITLVHELGHGLTCKYFGGEVHEMGFMLLYFQPAFYANVNDAWTFPELRARLWVTAAGSWIEAVLASIAGLVWLVADPGTLVSQVALLAFIFGGIVSVLTNANPLMPLDGYFALSDYLEIPNLRHRAFAHIGWLVRRYVLRMEVPMPPGTERERRVFLLYGIGAIGYMVMALFLVASVVMGWASAAFGFAGGALVLGMILLALRGQIRAWGAAVAMTLREHRAKLLSRRSRLWAGAGLVVLLLVLLLVPWSITVTGPFSMMPARVTALTAPDSGYVAAVLVREGTAVPAGAPLLRLRQFELEHAVLQERRAVDSLGLLEAVARSRGGAGEAERLARDRTVAEVRLAGTSERLRAGVLRAPASGVVLTARPEWLAGQWISAGETVLTLGEPDSVEARIRVRGSGATQVEPGQEVSLLSFADPANPVTGIVASVSRISATGDHVEVRVHLPAAPAWRPGASGEASIALRQSNVLGALVWTVRKRVRSDLLL